MKILGSLFPRTAPQALFSRRQNRKSKDPSAREHPQPREPRHRRGSDRTSGCRPGLRDAPQTQGRGRGRPSGRQLLELACAPPGFQMISKNRRKKPMGGYGSGRPRDRSTVEECLPLDVRKIRRGGWLSPGMVWELRGSRSGAVEVRVSRGTHPRGVELRYRTRQGPTGQFVDLEWMPQHLGGARPWWRCPSCGSRRAVLYLAGWFACRGCHDLAYESQQEDTLSRRTRRVLKLKERLGWDSTMWEKWGPKPRGMHWRTFSRLLRKLHRALEAEARAVPPEWLPPVPSPPPWL